MRKRLEFDLKYMSRRFLSTLCIDYTVENFDLLLFKESPKNYYPYFRFLPNF
jgi:hypothetical protein